MYRYRLLQLINLLTISFKVVAEWPGPITDAPYLFRRDDYPWTTAPSCTSWWNLESSCESKINHVSASQYAALLSCVCYTTSSSIIFSYDDALGTCLAYLKTASPAVFSSIDKSVGVWTKPCSEGSAYLSVASIVTDQRVSACASFGSIIASCALSTPGFTALTFSSKASCACYLSGGSKWAPQVFDGYFSSCLDYYHTYSTALYSSLSLTQTPCVSVGNIRGATSATGSEASASIRSPTSTSASGALTTSQPRATAAANYASDFGVSLDWLLLACAMVLPLIGILCL